MFHVKHSDSTKKTAITVNQISQKNTQVIVTMTKKRAAAQVVSAKTECFIVYEIFLRKFVMKQYTFVINK